MRILHICSGNLYGGVETIQVTLARYRGECAEIEPHFTVCFEGRLSQELQALQEKYKMPWLDLVYDENPNRIEAKPGHLLLPAIKAIQELAGMVETLTKQVRELRGE